MTDAIDKFFAAVDEYKRFADDPARAKLLEAVEEYAGLQLAIKTRALDDCEAQLVVYDKIAVRFKLLEAKARVCDAVLADPCQAAYRSPGTSLFNSGLYAAIVALRELEKTR